MFSISESSRTQIFNLILRTMEIFVGIKNDLRRLGCLHYDHPHKKLLNTIQLSVFFGISVVYFSTLLWFLIFEVKTFTDYVESFGPNFCGLIVIFNHLSFLWQREELLDLMMEFEHMIEKRKPFLFLFLMKLLSSTMIWFFWWWINRHIHINNNL